MGNISLFSSLFILYYNVQVKANIRQWGKAIYLSRESQYDTFYYGMTFPIKFPQSVFSIINTPFVSGDIYNTAGINEYSTTSVSFYFRGSFVSDAKIFVIAIGI